MGGHPFKWNKKKIKLGFKNINFFFNYWGSFEYYTNDDYLTENWQPRELEHSLVSFTEWAVEGGIDHDTRRQQKKTEAV